MTRETDLLSWHTSFKFVSRSNKKIIWFMQTHFQWPRSNNTWKQLTNHSKFVKQENGFDALSSCKSTFFDLEIISFRSLATYHLPVTDANRFSGI